MPFSFTGFGSTGVLVMLGIAVLIQVARYLRQGHSHGHRH